MKSFVGTAATVKLSVLRHVIAMNFSLVVSTEEQLKKVKGIRFSTMKFVPETLKFFSSKRFGRQ